MSRYLYEKYNDIRKMQLELSELVERYDGKWENGIGVLEDGPR